MKRFVTLFLIVALFTSSLVGCGSQKASSEPANSDASSSVKAEDAVVTGVINRIDDYLVVLDSDGNYLKFKVDEISLDEFSEGDEVKVTYTGTLSEESENLVAKQVVKK